MEKVLLSFFRNDQFSLRKVVESKELEKFIMWIIVLNGITLGLETIDDLSPTMMSSLKIIDSLFLTIFVFELILKLVFYKNHFFKDAWRIFDLVIVTIACIPSSGPFAIVRSLRVLRALRMISVVPSLRKVVNGLLSAIPGLSAVIVIIGIIFYVSGVMATKLFGQHFPEWFGSLSKSFYSLFQIMTLESWSMGIVRPVMEKYPYSWVFFLPFILITTFTMLNLFIAVIVNAMQVETDARAQEKAENAHDERQVLLNEIEEMKKMLEQIKRNNSI